MKMSPEIQAALDKKGITNRSIFEMIHAQYKKKTLQMLGVQQKKIGSEANPFNSLEGDKLEL